jgi:hypothetical protein
MRLREPQFQGDWPIQRYESVSNPDDRISKIIKVIKCWDISSREMPDKNDLARDFPDPLLFDPLAERENDEGAKANSFIPLWTTDPGPRNIFIEDAMKLI